MRVLVKYAMAVLFVALISENGVLGQDSTRSAQLQNFDYEEWMKDVPMPSHKSFQYFVQTLVTADGHGLSEIVNQESLIIKFLIRIIKKISLNISAIMINVQFINLAENVISADIKW